MSDLLCWVPARCRVKVALRHTYIILPQVTSHQRTSDQAQSRPGGQAKGVCHFKKEKKKKKNGNIHSPSLALTLTVTLSPNH